MTKRKLIINLTYPTVLLGSYFINTPTTLILTKTTQKYKIFKRFYLHVNQEIFIFTTG